MQRFELYNNLLQNGDKSECDELFNESLNKYELTLSFTQKGYIYHGDGIDRLEFLNGISHIKFTEGKHSEIYKTLSYSYIRNQFILTGIDNNRNKISIYISGAFDGYIIIVNKNGYNLYYTGRLN